MLWVTQTWFLTLPQGSCWSFNPGVLYSSTHGLSWLTVLGGCCKLNALEDEAFRCYRSGEEACKYPHRFPQYHLKAQGCRILYKNWLSSTSDVGQVGQGWEKGVGRLEDLLTS